MAVCLTSSFLGFYAHAGFLSELVARGVKPSHVSGASAGALVSGLYAAGMKPEEIVDALVDGGIRRSFFEAAFILRGAALTANWPGFTGLVSGEKTVAFLRRYVGDRKIEDCVDPKLAIAVTNLTRARPEVAVAGPLADFMAASCAVPVYCAARNIGGDLYWDGGIAASAPIDPWIGDPAVRTILVHHVVRERGQKLSVGTACGLSHQIISDELLRNKILRARTAGQVVLAHHTVGPRPGPFSGRTAKLAAVESGRAAARELFRTCAGDKNARPPAAGKSP